MRSEPVRETGERSEVGTDVGVVGGCNEVRCAEPRGSVYAATQA